MKHRIKRSKGRTRAVSIVLIDTLLGRKVHTRGVIRNIRGILEAFLILWGEMRFTRLREDGDVPHVIDLGVHI